MFGGALELARLAERFSGEEQRARELFRVLEAFADLERLLSPFEHSLWRAADELDAAEAVEHAGLVSFSACFSNQRESLGQCRARRLGVLGVSERKAEPGERDSAITRG